MNLPDLKHGLAALAAAAALLALPGHAAGLGGIVIKSALGQPFSAEVEVTGLQPDDLLTAQTRLGGPDDYQAARLAFIPVVRQIRVAMETVGSKTVLKLSSNAPITEPAINLLVEFSWRGGRVVQKYSILLDPPK